MSEIFMGILLWLLQTLFSQALSGILGALTGQAAA